MLTSVVSYFYQSSLCSFDIDMSQTFTATSQRSFRDFVPHEYKSVQWILPIQTNKPELSAISSGARLAHGITTT
jgi:hypothetical protein